MLSAANSMKNFFLSLKTTVWLLLTLVCLFFIGSYMMPVHREVFGPMNENLLFNWAVEVGLQNAWASWWFFAVLAALMLLTVNAVVCSVHAITGRWPRTDFLIRISPQVIHIGFLFILLGHLLGAGWGYKLSGMMREDSYARLPGDRVLYLRKIDVQSHESGYTKNWTAEASIYEHNTLAKSGQLGPNKPLFYRGAGIYLKSLNFESGPAAFLLVARDPGAAWALAGGILFSLGSVMVLVLKWKKA